MANSQDLLQETVFQLLSHHQSIDKTLAEVSSLKPSCKNEEMLELLLEAGCMPVLKSHDRQSGSQACTADVYINRLMSLSVSDQLSEVQKEELETLLLMLKQLKQADNLSTARFKDTLMEYPRIPLHILWTLHKEGIFNLESFLIMQQIKSSTSESFLSKMCQAREIGQVEVISGTLSELLYLGFSEGKTGSIKKKACDTVDSFLLDFVDDALKNRESKEVISISTVQLDAESLRRAFTHLLTIILSHRPVMKVSQAIREQSSWAYGKISPSLAHLFKQLLLPFEVGETLALLRQILEQQEVNWQLLLSLVSVMTVCLPETAKSFLEFIDGLLREGLESCDIETTIMGMLLVRQACFQGPHVFLSYSDWFQRTFSDGSRSLAGNRKSFTFLIKFLTDLVPYETAQHIKVHILHPPFVPQKCRQILTDYITLVKTRLEDLKESMDMSGGESSSLSAIEKGKLQLASEIENAVKLFETSGKVPTSIVEASIFKKPYYIGQFLPALLQPRPYMVISLLVFIRRMVSIRRWSLTQLPDFPDSKMKLIATLKRTEKIPPSMYTSYEKACKKEASQLLEGVFIDSDTEDDMELSPLEQMENTLQQLKNTVKTKEGKNTSKYTLPEVLSLLCERIENVLSVSPHGHLQSSACVTIDTENVRIESLQLKVIDALLHTVSQILQECYIDSNPKFTWLSKLAQSLSQYHTVVETLYKRIFTLLIKQGISLENHHVDCIAAILVEIQYLGDRLPWLQWYSKGQGHSCRKEKTSFAESIFDMLPVATSGWMGFTLRLTTSYLKYMFCVHVDIDQCIVLPTIVKKFFYLSTRQNTKLRNHSNPGERTGAEDIVSAVFMSDTFQNFISVYPLTVSDWVDYEISVCPEDDILTDFQRYEYFTWIMYRFFLVKGQGDYYGIASAVVWGILKNDLRMHHSAEGCTSCHDVNVKSSSNSRSYLVNLLQELTRMFIQCNSKTDELPWLPQQLTKHFQEASGEIQKNNIVQQFLRLCLSLPAYLMFSDKPYMLQGQNTLWSIATLIHDLVMSCVCEGLYLPASSSVYLCQGLCQVSGTVTIDEIMKEFGERCPVFMMSLMVNSEMVEPFLLPALKQDSLLKYYIECTRGKDFCCNNTVDPWQQAAVMFSMTCDSAHRVGDSILKGFIESSRDVGYQYKVCCCLVQMLLLQLTHIHNFQETQEQTQSDKLKSVLTDVLQWVDMSQVAGMFLTDEIEEKTRLCVSDGLVKVKNLTVLRFFVGHIEDANRDKFHSMEFITGILRAYRDVLTMFDQQCEQLIPLKVAEILSEDNFLVTLIESTSPSILRQVDQDLLLSCGPAVAECTIRKLSS